MVRTKVATLFLDEHEIVHLEFPQKGIVIDLAQTKEIFEARIKMFPTGEKHLLLVDITTNPCPNRESRDFARSEEMQKCTMAMAMIIDNALSQFLGNLFLGFKKGEFPVKLFTDKTEAVAWLLKQKIKCLAA